MRQGLFFFVSIVCLFFSGCGGSPGSSCAPVTERSLNTAAFTNIYRVRAGDSLYSVAWAFGLDYRHLIKINHLHPPFTIRQGQLLRVKGTETIHSKSIRVSAMTIPRHHWMWPVKGPVRQEYSSQAFGNKGINIGGRLGSPVVATASGIVVYSGAAVRGYGNLLIVKHNQSYLSAYAFNKRNLVKEGTRVREGQKIAELGQNNSGRVMLHFEVRHNGRPVNPRLFLR